MQLEMRTDGQTDIARWTWLEILIKKRFLLPVTYMQRKFVSAALLRSQSPIKLYPERRPHF